MQCNILLNKAIGQAPNTSGQASYYLARVVQASGYYPFGWTMPGKKVESEYRYGFNGTEKVEELGSGHNTTFYREQDTRVARWWSFDPRPNAAVSPFAMMEGNPIMFSDMLGDTVVGEGSIMVKYKDFRNEVNTRLQKAKASLAVAKGNKGKRKQQSIISEMEAINDELNALEASEQVYVLQGTFRKSIQGGGLSAVPAMRANGIIYKDVIRVNINLSPGRNSSVNGRFSHELKHAFQYESRQLVIPSDGQNSSYWNVADEIEAYRRQLYFDRLTNPPNTPYPGQPTSYADINARWIYASSAGYNHLRGTSSTQRSITYVDLISLRQQNSKIYLEHMRNGKPGFTADVMRYKGWQDDTQLDIISPPLLIRR